MLRVTDPGSLTRARAIVVAELDAIDLACSRFRSDSELVRLNALAGGRAVRVSSLLIEALTVALRAAELTDGAVDPTVGAALVLAGYDRDWRLLDSAPVTSSAPSRHVAAVRARLLSGWQSLALDPHNATIRVPRGVSLDLGATAKAWAADRAARAAHEACDCGVLVSLGGDIATAGPAPAAGWRIHVTEDHRSGPGAPGQTISIRAGGLATSSTATRRWRQGEATMHHIIDPVTGAPAAGIWRTVSVAAADCTDANIASTAALVRGDTAVAAWLADRRLPARLVAHDGAVLHVGDWPAARRAPAVRPALRFHERWAVTERDAYAQWGDAA
ncbi:MAG TPA: FAD:protein FMN transferase [Solirubrobacteraceae bacterium]|nr:FAD:protein FMN transferase [Solirubrobacteraceae bacterium]